MSILSNALSKFDSEILTVAALELLAAKLWVWVWTWLLVVLTLLATIGVTIATEAIAEPANNKPIFFWKFHFYSLTFTYF